MNPASSHGRPVTPVCLLLLMLALLQAQADGLEYLIEIRTNDLVSVSASPVSQSQIVEALRKRAQALGGGEVEAVGGDRIRVRLFNLRDEAKPLARGALERSGALEFRLVHPQSDALIANGEVVPGYEVLQQRRRRGDGIEQTTSYLVKRRSERGLNSSHVARAFVARNQMGEPEISFELNPEGAALFAQVTRDNIGSKLAIVLDGTLCSAPVIKTEISGGRAVIEGGMEVMEAVVLASAIESPMTGPLKIVSERPVDPDIERAYRRREWLRPLLLALGALAAIGAVLAGLGLLFVRRLRTKSPTPAPPVPP